MGFARDLVGTCIGVTVNSLIYYLSLCYVFYKASRNYLSLYYLHRIMDDILENCVKYGTEANGYINYVKGANVAGFMKVAKAMMAQGIV